MSQTGRSTEQEAHDVLAAEAFAMPAPDPDRHHGPVLLPEDPTGEPAPHDVLAAEEFPMPAPRLGDAGGGSGGLGGSIRGRGSLKIAAATGALLLLARRALRR